MADPTNTPNNELDGVKKDLAALRTDLSNLVASLATAGADSVGAAAGKAAAYGSAGMSMAQSCVSRHPLTSVAVAFGVGSLIGKICARKPDAS